MPQRRSVRLGDRIHIQIDHGKTIHHRTLRVCECGGKKHRGSRVICQGVDREYIKPFMGRKPKHTVEITNGRGTCQEPEYVVTLAHIYRPGEAVLRRFIDSFS